MQPHGTGSSPMVILVVAALTVITLQATEESNTLLNRTGTIQREERIIGGRPTSITKFPWQVYMRTTKDDDYTYSCGGVIINNIWILSAAHCFAKKTTSQKFRIQATRIEVYAGLTKISERHSDSDVQDNEINEAEFKDHLFIKSDYGYKKGAILNNDIALIKMKKSFVFNGKVGKIDLAAANDFNSNKEAIASGWGWTDDAGTSPDILQYVDGLQWKDCNLPAYTSIICTKTRNKNICDGDSGGPLITGKGSSSKGPPYVLIGITSFGTRLCEPYNPSAFTDVAMFRDWIAKTIKNVVCYDKRDESDCEYWACKGYCKTKYVKFMTKNCKKTCNKCEDVDGTNKNDESICEHWASRGYCIFKHVDFMTKNCKKTCNKCEDVGTDKKRESQCKTWACKGYCKTKYVYYMNKNCKKTCNKFEDSDCIDKRDESACEYWAGLGYCTTKYVAYMIKNCKKTCKKCSIII